MTTTWLILSRAVHIGACLLFFGTFAFDRFVATAIFTGHRTETSDYWQGLVRRFSLVLLPLILLSGILWFIMVTISMSGQPLQMETIKIVWMQTHFGTVWKIRLCLWFVAGLVATCFQLFKSQARFPNGIIRLQLLLGGALVGSLAWAGHGVEDSPWHLAADILHLIVAGFWPAGLLPLILLLNKLRANPGLADENSVAILVHRFSAISIASVALLTITGFINAWFLVGSWSNLVQLPYGRWLLAKIILFCLTVAIGAVNLLRLKPRLGDDQNSSQDATVVQLRCNVWAELFISLMVIVIVAVLGILPPASH